MRHAIHAFIMLGLIGTFTAAPGAVTMPAVFGDHMVLQREVPVAIFGQADPNEQIQVSFAGDTKTTKADAKGAWLVHLDPMPANAKGETLAVRGSNTITFTDVVVGEVWVGSGQSNMRWTLERSLGKEAVLSAGSNPAIRTFMVPFPKEPRKKKNYNPKDYWSWHISDKSSLREFSAVQYYFGARLQAELGVPVGLICSARGSSSIDPWQVGGGFYEPMIKPLQPFTVRGVIWYQGESDVQRKTHLTYKDEFQRLITEWRATWQLPEMPFYYVQIAPWSGDKYAAGDLPILWEAQAAALKLPHTGMAVVTDKVDSLGNIHPYDKQPVGDRLALWALAKDFGQDVAYSGPLFKAATVEGKQIRISFAHAEGLQSSDGQELTEFRIAGADGSFVDAQAVIDGETIVVSSPQVSSPKQVQFGWHNTAQPNLVNGAGLPASPFHTNDWQGGTGD